MRRSFVLAIPVALLMACSEEPISEETFTADCTGADTFAQGMVATSAEGLQVTLEAADPAPTDVGDNTWTLSIALADGTPAEGLAPQIRPWMPLHGHGAFPTHYAATESAPGVYDFEAFDVIMPGLWEFWVELTDQGKAGDQAMFALCAEG